jgi:hypothetical protein
MAKNLMDSAKREGENPNTPPCQLGKPCPTPARECPECAKEYLAEQKEVKP